MVLLHTNDALHRSSIHNSRTTANAHSWPAEKAAARTVLTFAPVHDDHVMRDDNISLASRVSMHLVCCKSGNDVI